ncbi:MAG: hypothetical protein RLZ98_1609 [Pseudomonadota bacterium]
MESTMKSGWLWGPYSKLGLGLAAATLIIDQLHKWWTLEVYRLIEKGVVAITPFLNFNFTLNKGISYGLLTQHSREGQLLLASFAFVAAIALAVWLARGATNRIMAASIGLIIGGAISNAIDRLYLGGVADYIQLHAFGYSWYVFNIADVAIVAGVIGLLYDSFWSSRNGAAKAS